LKDKSGVYCWFNRQTSKFYIGSAVNLITRINRYFQNSYLLSRVTLIITRALVKYGINNFSLIILEITERADVLNREQFFFL